MLGFITHYTNTYSVSAQLCTSKVFYHIKSDHGEVENIALSLARQPRHAANSCWTMFFPRWLTRRQPHGRPVSQAWELVKTCCILYNSGDQVCTGILYCRVLILVYNPTLTIMWIKCIDPDHEVIDSLDILWWYSVWWLNYLLETSHLSCHSRCISHPDFLSMEL